MSDTFYNIAARASREPQIIRKSQFSKCIFGLRSESNGREHPLKSERIIIC